MFLANSLLLLTTTLALLLGLSIYISNPKRAVNRALTLFIVSVFIWLLANLLTNVSSTSREALFFGRTTLIGPILLAYFFLIFCKIYTNTKDFGGRQIAILGAVPFLLLLTTPTSLNVKSIEAFGQNTVTGPAYFLLVPLILVYFVWGCWVLVNYSKHTADNVIKAQIRYIFVGIVLSVVPGLLANGVLPLLGYSSAVFYGPNAVIFLAIMMSLAILRHRLLDIRLIVARSLAYILSLLSLAGVFIFGTFALTSVFFQGSDLSTSQLRGIYTILAAALAFLFAPLKGFFDRNTSKLFFRDAYDTQVFLDDFNKTLVVTYELDDLLKKSAEIVEANLKPTYCLFAINETVNTQGRVMGSGSKTSIDPSYLSDIKHVVAHTKQKLIVTDELTEAHGSLQRQLRSKDIVLLARLAASSTSHKPDVGYLMIGPKKSGNLYSSQDLKVIEIIANELVIAVQNALRFEEIENFNITLQGKVDEATKKLRRANEKLRQLDETKDDFISMASHQLRTPLTSVKGYISMVLEGDAGKITHMQREMLGQAFFSSQRMVYLIADLLNVSRLKTGKFIIEPTPVNLADVVEQELSQLEETAASRQLTLGYDKPKNFPTLMLDETKTRQVIMNFVDNAIYYTPAKGHIDVKLVDNHTTVELRVADDGIGVPKSEQPHLFTKFYRAGNARKARPDGTGLGLFMAKKVIVAQGGSLLFESQEGKGSTFGFTFNKHKLTANGKKPVAAEAPTDKAEEAPDKAPEKAPDKATEKAAQPATKA